MAPIIGGEAWDRIRNSRYTKEDCLRNVSVYNWAMGLSALCRAFGMLDEMWHMRQVYQGLDAGLRSLVSAPSSTVSFDDYINHIAENNLIWRSILLEGGNELLADNTCLADTEETNSGNSNDNFHSSGNQ
ncbi:hypothetical protein F4813DRAFT_369778 [Daldinia decipiens]|uniref:uncharacterized protein n=1 Tax=Daldinia decipiens TaxID=326647 RepID=UPI0020C54CE3|nr:uncharacterized protein F4813DRAFT_369778 [Daldinia decipiens]KAI1654662.1 hypothetical protein F4813DRAFT_369778 [Daldinia decipiens]